MQTALSKIRCVWLTTDLTDFAVGSDGEVLAVPYSGFGWPDHPAGLLTVVCAWFQTFQPGHPGQQGLQADTHEIRHYRIVLAGGRVAADDLSGHPDDRSARGDLLDHDGVRADAAV